VYEGGKFKARIYTVTDLQKEKYGRSTSPPHPYFYQFPKWFKGQVGKKPQMKAERREEKLQT
jgi:hypothetical protein